MVADAAGSRMLRDETEGHAGQPEDVGRQLAQRMLALGAGQIVAVKP
jgi:porphobilinogen deaminase